MRYASDRGHCSNTRRSMATGQVTQRFTALLGREMRDPDEPGR